MSKSNSNFDRISALKRLVAGIESLPELEVRLKSMPFDSEPLVTLTASHVGNMLMRFAKGEISSDQVEQWANFIEVRDDIAFDPEHEAEVKQAMHELANPVLFGPLDLNRARTLQQLLE